MTDTALARENTARYRIEPTVLQALRSPRLLTREALAGLVVAIAFLGGRPAMITAATGAIALVVAPVAREHGVDYLIATVMLGGLIQIVFPALGGAGH